MSRRGMGSRAFLAKRPGLRAYLAIIKDDPCVWCTGLAGTVDHIVPESKWDHGMKGTKRTGPHHWTNVAMSCRSCNSRRSNKGLLVFLLLQYNRCTVPDAARAAASPQPV